MATRRSLGGLGAASTLPRHRNGSKLACEPCRVRKVACDHQLPVCSRCQNGRTPSSCVYIVDRRRQRRRLPSKSPAAPLSLSPLGNGQLRGPASQDLPPRASHNGVGYLGATNFAVVFQDSQTIFPLQVGNSGLDDLPPPDPIETAHPDAMALAVLQSIPDHATCKSLFDHYVNPLNGWFRLGAQLIMERLWLTYGLSLADPRSTTGLEQMAKTVWKNTSTPLGEDFASAKDWLGAFTGQNLRWESLGLLFCYWASGAKFVTDQGDLSEPAQIHGVDQRQTFLKYKRSASMCLELCKKGSTANLLHALLLYRYSGIEAAATGDLSKSFNILRLRILDTNRSVYRHADVEGSRRGCGHEHLSWGARHTANNDTRPFRHVGDATTTVHHGLQNG